MMADSNFSNTTGAANPMIVGADWNAGTPDAAGWYVASTDRDPDMRRHWSGSAWSAPAYSDAPAENFNRARNTPADTDGDAIEWQVLTKLQPA